MSARAKALSLLDDARHDHNTREAELLVRSAQVYATLARVEAAERQNQLLRDAVTVLGTLGRKVAEWLADDMQRTARKDTQ